MNCDEIGKSLVLYFYGELAPAEEELVEDHLDGCANCRAAMERQRDLAGALDRRAMDAPPDLLDDCRDNLMAAVHSMAIPAAAVSVPAVAPPRQSLAERFAALWDALWGLRQPIGAVALLLLGYLSGRIANVRPQAGAAEIASLTTEPAIARVRAVQPDASGRVQISLDEVRKRVISGRLDDSHIQQLLLAAARDESDPGVRVESMDILKDHGASSEIRAALLHAVAHDSNPGVRLKALEGLKNFAADAEVRRTVAQLLLTDENPGVRIQAIDMLTASRDESVVGVLQSVVGKEDNSYVRWRCEKALKDMNASVGTF